MERFLLFLIVAMHIPTYQSFKSRNQEPPSQCVKEENDFLPWMTSRDLEKTTDPPPNCNLESNFVNPNARIALDFVGLPSRIKPSDVATLRTLIQSSYNGLPFCSSPHFLQITSVELATPLSLFDNVDTGLDQEGLEFSLEFSVTTTCRGCNADATLPHLFSSSSSSSSSACPCEGPSVSLFRIAFGERLQSFLDSRQISSIFYLERAAEVIQIPGVCPDFVEFTTSDVVVEFFGCPLDLTASNLEAMASQFLKTYNRLNHLSARYCDRFFREITSATAVLEDDFTVDFGRRLDEQEFPIEATRGGDDDLSAASGRRRKHRHLQDFQCPDFFEIRFDVTARCRGCNASTITLFDEAEDVNSFSGFDDHDDDDDDDDDDKVKGDDDRDDNLFNRGRRHTEESMVPSQHWIPTWIHRLLQTESPCQCPVDPEFRAITEEEMISGYNLALRTIANTLPDISVEDVIEIVVVDCDDQVNEFESFVDVALETDATNEAVITQDFVNTLSRNFERSYNDLTDRFCDPFFRRVVRVEATPGTLNPVGGQRMLQTASRPRNFTVNFVFSFKIKITGVCRGCPRKSKATNDAARRRLDVHQQRKMSPPKVISDTKHRNLQTSNQCFCAAVNVVNGAPTEREVAERYSTDLARLSAGGALSDQYAVSFLEEEEDEFTVTEPPRIECITTADCPIAGTFCLNNECLNNGNPRFTLTWTGDDDIDLVVFTPAEREIYYLDPFDPVSKGVFDTSFVQNTFGPHVESIYFPVSGSAPGGEYRVEILAVEQVDLPDNWKLEVFISGKIVPDLVVEGIGSKTDISYIFGDVTASTPIPSCNVADALTQCCSDADCLSNSIIARSCVNRQCVSNGNPRITLTSFGNDELALTVLTPELGEIFDESPVDAESGGIFESDRNADIKDNTFHTQSIFFPEVSPNGEYAFFVDVMDQRGVLDLWQVVVNVGGEDVVVKRGSGSSDYFSYFKPECTRTQDCLVDNEICFSGRCIFDGNPRFTLSWEGGDDLDLYVVPPVGERIDFEYSTDEESGGVLEADFDEIDGRNMEYAYFDIGKDGPIGTYTVGVETYFVRDKRDPWVITVHVEGKQRERFEGIGDMEFTYEYNGIKPVTFACFSGDTTVVTENRGKILMQDLRLGDKVSVSTTSFAPVYSFGHRNDSILAEYLQIWPSKIEMSADHMIFVEGGSAVPASKLRIGNRLLNGDYITAIKHVTRKGVYAPFTSTGTLLVNNVTVSSYVAFQESERLLVGAYIKTPFTYQWLAHTAQFPHRFWCRYMSKCLRETYNQIGVSAWVDLPNQLARRFLELGNIQMVFMSVALLCLFFILFCLEFCLVPAMLASSIIYLLWRKPKVLSM